MGPGDPLNYSRKERRALPVFYWLYDIPILLLIGLFTLVFVGLCWLGTVFLSPIIAPWFQGKRT